MHLVSRENVKPREYYEKEVVTKYQNEHYQLRETRIHYNLEGREPGDRAFSLIYDIKRLSKDLPLPDIFIHMDDSGEQVARAEILTTGYSQCSLTFVEQVAKALMVAVESAKEMEQIVRQALAESIIQD